MTVACNLRPFLLSSPQRRLLIGWRTHSSVWNTTCCFWDGRVETDALSRFNCTAVLTHNPFEPDQVCSVLKAHPCWFSLYQCRTEKRSACDVKGTSATHAGIVPNVTDTGCQTQHTGSGDSLVVGRRTRDRKVSGSIPGRNGGRIFFSSVNFLC